MSGLDVDLLIPAGYTILPEEDRQEAIRKNLRSGNEEVLIGLDKSLHFMPDPETGKKRPLIYPIIRAGIESKHTQSMNIVGSREVGKVLDDLVWLAEHELTSFGRSVNETELRFIEMYHPTRRELSKRSLTKIMDLEHISIYHNLVRMHSLVSGERPRLMLGQDLVYLNGPVIDRMIEDVLPGLAEVGATFNYSLISKVTLGRNPRSYMRVIDDRFGNSVNQRDIYGRVSLKESNASFFFGRVPNQILDALAAFYSIRKMNNISSLLNSLNIGGMDVPELNVPIGRTIPKKMKSMGRVFRVAAKYVVGKLSVSYAEGMADRILSNYAGIPSPAFSFFEMKYPHFSQDIDSIQDISGQCDFNNDALRADFHHLASNPEEYFGRVVLLNGQVSDLSFHRQAGFSRKNTSLNLLASLMGYKEISFTLKNDGRSINCYRSKYRNLIFNTLIPALIDRIYMEDERSEFLSIEPAIDSIATYPRLKYEEMVNHLEKAGIRGDKVYVSGRVTPSGIWMHEVITPRNDDPGRWKKYYFKHHCPDPRCEVWQRDQEGTMISSLQSAIKKVTWSSRYRSILRKLRRD